VHSCVWECDYEELNEDYDLYMKGQDDEAMVLHRKAALAESPVKAGIALTNYAAAVWAARAARIDGTEEKLAPRRPYTPVADGVKDKIRSVMAEIRKIEASLCRFLLRCSHRMIDSEVPTVGSFI